MLPVHMGEDMYFEYIPDLWDIYGIVFDVSSQSSVCRRPKLDQIFSFCLFDCKDEF